MKSMKKLLSLFIAMSMVVTFSFGGAIQAFGELTASATGSQLTVAPQSETGPWPEALAGRSDTDGGYVPNQALVMFRASDEPLTKSQAIRALSTGNHSIGDFKVKNLWTFQPKPEYTTNSAGKKKLVLVGKDDAEYVQVALVTSESLSTAQLISTLKKRSDVLYAEPNYRVKAQGVTDDPYSDHQWSMQSGDATPNVSYQWETTGTTGSDKIVAVVDTGVDYTHPDLQRNMWVNTHYPALRGIYGVDFIGGDDDPMDDDDHGTHCAGVIGAAGNNGVGISGVNQSVKIMALKALGADGSGSLGAIISAYNYVDRALDLGEPIVAVNASLGFNGYDETTRILEEVINVVGEKGAITVAAAGNESEDNDAVPLYPASCNSPYVISVAATREDGALAGFSNYGKKEVDITAPGANILSTVWKSSYNPSIYGDSQRDYSARFDDFESEAGWQSVTEFAENVYVNGEKASLTLSEGAYRSADGKVVISQSERAFVPQGTARGSSLQIEANGLEKGDLVCLPVPYQVSKTARSAPHFSVMSMTKSDGYNGFLMYDVEQGTSLSKDELESRGPKESRGIGESDFDFWFHLTFPTMDEAELQEAIRQSTERDAGAPDPLKRWVVLCIKAGDGGNAKVNLDDMGVSVDPTDKTPDYFGKYDFMSGTSQATPYVSGAVALKAAELGDDADPATLVNEVLAMARTDDQLPVAEGRSLDFRVHPTELAPYIGAITVSTDDGTLTIHGSGLAPTTGTTVEIGDGEDSLVDAQIVSRDDHAIIVKDEGWANNVKTVKVTGYQGKSNVRRDVYLVDGKKSLAEGDWCGVSVTDFGMATDGKRIYWTDKGTGTIQAVDPGNLEAGQTTLATIRPEKIFGTKKSKTTEYRMEFGDHLTYCNGSLYALLDYGAYYEGEEEASTTTVYSSELRLVGVSLGGDAGGAGPAGTVTNLGKLPADLEKVQDCAMAAFNGKLYFMGGYLHDGLNQGVTGKVWIYDPATKVWSDGPSLPEGRAGGRALQYGDSLVLAMGYTDAMASIDIYDQSYSATLVFDGEKWTTGEKRIEPLMIRWVKRQNGVYYLFPEPEISLVKGGLLFTGQPVEDYGDVFFYTTDGDEFADSGYNFVGNLADGEMRGIAVGGTYYGFADGYVYQFPVESGLVEVAAAASPHGTVTGTGSFVPGNTATANVAADSGYRIKSLRLNGKAVELAGNPTSYALALKDLVEDQLIAAEFEPVPVEPAPVKPLDISGAKVSSAADQVYNGKKKRPAVTVTLAGKTLKPGTDYSVEYRNNTNVGTATIVVTGMSAGTGGYTGTVTSTFRIVKAPNPLSPKGKTVKASYSTLKSKSQVVKRASAIDLGKAKPKGKVTYSKLWGDGLISVDKKTGNLTLAKSLKPYTYEVGVLICAAGNGNYSPAKEYVNVTVKVSKAENTLSATGKKATVSAAKLKKASVNVSRSRAIKVSNAKGALSYAKVSGNKKIAVDAKTGKLTVAKGLKKGSYKVKVKVTAKGNSYYKSTQKTVTATVWVK